MHKWSGQSAQKGPKTLLEIQPYFQTEFQSLTWQSKAKSDAKIKDIDIRVCFQDPVNEPGFGNEDGKTGEKGGDQDWGEKTIHSQISQPSGIC